MANAGISRRKSDVFVTLWKCLMLAHLGEVPYWISLPLIEL